LDVENVKYVIVGPSTMLPSTRFDLVHDGDMRVYQNRHVLPRAFLATNVTVISDFDRALQFLRSEQFQPDLTAIVDKHVRTSESKANVFSDIRVTSYTNTHVSVHAATSTDGLLVLSDTFYPGWRATVDGKRTDVIRTNVAMRGIELPAGVHVVEFSYQPLSLAVGRVLSVGSICAALIVITVDFLRTWHWRTTAPGAVATIS